MRAQGKKVQRTASLALLTFGLIAHSAALAQTGAGAQTASGAQTAQTAAQNTWSGGFDNLQLAFLSARNERWVTPFPSPLLHPPSVARLFILVGATAR